MVLNLYKDDCELREVFCKLSFDWIERDLKRTRIARGMFTKNSVNWWG